LIILLQRIEAEHQRTGRTIGTQAHVDAKHEAVDSHRVQRLDQALAQTNEEFLVVQRALHPLGFTAFGVGENQVDVRRQIQFQRSQLAHAEDDHLLWLVTAAPGGRPELLTVPVIQPSISKVDTAISHVGQVTTGFDQIGLPGEVTPDNSDLLPRPLTT
jgi:hypothetical protein